MVTSTTVSLDWSRRSSSSPPDLVTAPMPIPTVHCVNTAAMTTPCFYPFALFQNLIALRAA